MDKILYLGIDVSKSKLDLAATFDSNIIISTTSCSNNKTGFKKLLIWIQKLTINQVHVCLESTNTYHEDVSEFLRKQKNFCISIVNPRQTKYFAKSLNQRSKTDKIDASMLAKFCALHKPNETIPISAEIKELRALTRYLDSLIVDKTREQCRIQSVKNNILKKLISKKLNFIEKQINEVHSLIEIFLKNHSIIKEKIDLIDSIEHIGEKTACCMFVEMIDPENLSTKAQVAHAGLDPSRNESGESVKGKPKISRTGNKRLRRALYMPAVSSLSKKGYFRNYYDRLISKGKTKKSALTAVMKKMLATASGVLRSGKPFDANWVSKKDSNLAIAV